MPRPIAPICVSVAVILLATNPFALAQSRDQDAGERSSQLVSRIAELISTPRRETESHRTLRIRGTISVVAGLLGDDVINPSDKSFCVEDESGGIWVRVKQAMDEQLLEDASVLGELRAGVIAEIEGSLHPGGFAPVILPRRIEVVGNGTLNPPIRPNLKDFFRGAHIMRRVTVGGVVQNVTDDSPGLLVRVETGAGHFLTRLPDRPEVSPEKLMDAEIRVTGVAGASRNWRSQFICPRVMIARSEDFEILRTPAADPFQAERVRIDELDGFQLEGRSLHRRSLEGVVTYYDDLTTMYVESEAVAIRLELNQPTDKPIRIGDRVEAAGFIDSTHYLRGLRGAVVKPLGERAEIIPERTSIDAIINDHFKVPTWKQVLTKTYDGRVVRLRGVVSGFDTVATQSAAARIAVDDGDRTFTASLHKQMEPIAAGTLVELTGIAKITYAQPDSTSVLAQPTQVDLLLRSPSDVLIVRRPSWWTVGRIRAALAIALLVAVLAVVWAVTLNRRVARQTQLLAKEMRSRRDAVIEFQAAIRERTQLAANIHDTVLQTLAGIGFQLDACGQDEATGEVSTQHLQTASRMVQGGQEDLRNIVSALHCLPLDDQSFGESVRRVVKRLAQTGPNGATPEIVVECAADLPKPADFIAGNLLLLIQEAARNAIKHSQATSISISVRAQANSQLLVTVSDNGRGFDNKTRPRQRDGHFGLETMKGRAERIGGTLAVESEVGKGTTITASAPLKSFDEAIT